ncbi:restriction endonuclease subunit S [Flavicella sp.]|uniref:restriction endonuclease subunit S n=1 Tax=Flavicella sp. TaxID=2957742 RepID=UPI00301B551E
MNKEKQNIVPALRFPEFEGNWNVLKGENITDKITKGSSPKWQGFNYVDKGILFVTSENVRDGFLDISKPKYLEYGFHEKQKNSQLKKGDVLINIVGASIGRSTIYNLDIEANINQAVAIFRVKKHISNNFISYCLQLDETQESMFGVQSESARPNLSLTNLKELIFNIPIYSEQQKIANCLSSLDNLITAETEKLDHLKDHKKGLLQQLFPAKGETKPQFRFPEFENDGDWEEKTLGDCLDYLQPTPYLVSSTDYKDEYATPVLTAGKTFILGYSNEKEGIFTDKLPVIIFDDFTTASKFVDFPFKAKSSAMKMLLVKEDNNIKFLFETIQNLNFEVSTHKRHWISVFSKLDILIPKDPKEQEKIANCFSSTDDLIKAETTKIETLKAHKKGLMQQLFPNSITN